MVVHVHICFIVGCVFIVLSGSDTARSRSGYKVRGLVCGGSLGNMFSYNWSGCRTVLLDCERSYVCSRGYEGRVH